MRIFTLILGLFVLPLLASAQLPTDFPGLELWLRADSALELSGARVVTWPDLGPQQRDLTQSINNFRPFIEENALGDHRAVRFNGTNQRMLFDEISNVRTVFWVLSEDADATGFRPVMGHSTTFPFFRGPNQSIWHPEATDLGIREGITRLGFEEIDGLNTDFGEGYEIMSLVTTSDVVADQFGQDRNINHFWKGTLVELIVFSEPLSPDDVAYMEGYLADVYGVEYIALENVSAPNLCSVTLEATEGFSSYQWSNGDETNATEISSPGTYWVEVVDAFGRVIRDSVEVSFPGNLSLPTDSTICLGSTFEWDLDLPVGYAVEWSNGTMEDQVSIAEAQTLNAMIQDNQGCSYQTNDLIIQVNEFDLDLSIGEEEQLCEGNALFPEAEGFEIETFTWQNELQDESYIVEISEEVSIEAIDTFGCIGRDTLEVEIIGTAPQFNIFVPNTLCAGEEVWFFTDHEDSEFEDDYDWVLDGQLISSTQELLFLLPQTVGAYEFQCDITTVAGCTGTQQVIFNVNQALEINPVLGVSCEGAFAMWSTASNQDLDSIADITWIFEGQEYNSLYPQPLLENAGFIDLNIEAVSNQGCATQVSSLVNVIPVPEIVISTEGNCTENLVLFNYEAETSIETGDVLLQTWAFGDAGVSTIQAPLHLYTEAANYNVDLEVDMSTGCTARASSELQMFDPPVIDLPSLSSCVGFDVSPEIELEETEDPISAWSWEVESLGAFDEEQPVFAFTMSDFYMIGLSVETEGGCNATASTIYSIADAPFSEFSFTPEVAESPAEIQFINNSANATDYSWEFGDGETSSLPNPSHVYGENGTYEVTLTAISPFGCSIATTNEIVITQPIRDLVVAQWDVIKVGEWYEVSVLLFNNGNISSTNRLWTVNAFGVLAEEDQTLIPPGNAGLFTFSTFFSSNLERLCFEVQEIGQGIGLSPVSDNVPADNEACLAFDNKPLRMLPISPNPVSNSFSVPIIASFGMEFELVLIGMDGRVVYESGNLFAVEGYQEHEISVIGVQDGVYSLRMLGESAEDQQMILKVSAE